MASCIFRLAVASTVLATLHSCLAATVGGWNKKVIGAARVAFVAPSASRVCDDKQTLSMANVAKEEPLTDAEFVRQQLAEKEAAYEEQRREEVARKLQQELSLSSPSSSSSSASSEIPSLESLPLIPYIDSSTGKVTTCPGVEKARASAYAIYDCTQAIQYIGVSRDLQQSLRIQLGRRPELTYYYKAHHITKPSRALLDYTCAQWTAHDLGGENPPGNDGATQQALWESPLNVKPLMTEEDRAAVEAGREKSRVAEESAMKAIARRFEADKVEILTARGVQEELRFDPKLKGQGLLDFYTPKDNSAAVPTTKPPRRAAGKRKVQPSNQNQDNKDNDDKTELKP